MFKNDLLKNNFDGSEKPLQSIGYKETLEYLQTDLSKEKYIEKLFISTRQLAKAQRTFFNKMKHKLEYHPIKNSDKLINDIIHFVNS